MVDASSNCPGTVNTNWFNSGIRRRLGRKGGGSRRGSRNNTNEIHWRFRKSDKKTQESLSQPDEMDIEVEECDDGRSACPVPDYFEDCTDMTDEEVNSLTVIDIVSMEGLNECQIVTREQEYPFAKSMGYLRQLCNGCMDPVCDHSIYYDKCAIHDYHHDNADAIKSAFEPKQDFHENMMNNNKFNQYDNEHYAVFTLNESVIFWILSGLLVVNIICLVFYCWNNYQRKSKKQGYRVVAYDSEVTDV